MSSRNRGQLKAIGQGHALPSPQEFRLLLDNLTNANWRYGLTEETVISSESLERQKGRPDVLLIRNSAALHLGN